MYVLFVHFCLHLAEIHNMNQTGKPIVQYIYAGVTQNAMSPGNFWWVLMNRFRLQHNSEIACDEDGISWGCVWNGLSLLISKVDDDFKVCTKAMDVCTNNSPIYFYGHERIRYILGTYYISPHFMFPPATPLGCCVSRDHHNLKLLMSDFHLK